MKFMTEIGTRHKIIGILLLNTVALITYLISIQLAYPIFQNTRLIDPLAEMHVLFPLYYVAIVLIAVAGFFCFAWRINNKGIHLLLLFSLGIMLWYTPHYLAEFSHNPDVARDIGMAIRVPQILGGEANPYSWYCENYPSSYIFSWIFLNTTGIGPLNYMLLFPALCICMFILLGYAFVSRLFISRIAFWALLLAIPGMHYAIFHASAHSLGLLLLFTSVVLLFHRGFAFRILTVFTIIATFICHPISPLLLSIFIAAALIVSYTGRIGKKQLVIAAMLVVCFAGWFFWPSIQLTSVSSEVADNAALMYERINPGGLATTKEYLSRAPFIYANIHRLNIFVYVLYAFTTGAGILYVIFREYTRRDSLRSYLIKLGGLTRNQVFLIISAFALLVFTILLAETDHTMMERGLTFIILVLSCLISSISVGLYSSGVAHKFISFVGLGMILFLTLSYPVIAYSIEAYTNFPASEGAALEFIAKDVLFEKKTLTDDSSEQLVMYTVDFIPVPPPEDEVSKGAEVVSFRSTDYYYTAMRHDLSFEDNSFTRYLEAVTNCVRYNKAYINPTTEIFVMMDS
jgi:hypothetical protein